MRIFYLVIKEIFHRKLNAILVLLSISFVTGFIASMFLILDAFDQQTESLLAQKSSELHTQLQEMENEIRKITKRMGFNVLILPKDQELSDFYAENYADKFMPESYADTLSSSKSIVSIRHLLPMLQQKLIWPEQKRKVLVIGVKGEMPWAHRNNMKPILQPVPKNTMVMGYELHRSLGIHENDNVVFMGKEFTVQTLHPERGTIEDITIWIDLAQAQELLQKPNLINSIMALECKCAWANLAKVRAEIATILPQTQVIELKGKALARAEVRIEAERNAVAVLTNMKKSRQELKNNRNQLITTLIPFVIIICSIWIGLLVFLNAKERRSEIGILRTVGFRRLDIILLFMNKSILLGLFGGAIGVLVGTLITNQVTGLSVGAFALFSTYAVTMVLIIAGGCLVSIIASWLPALWASNQEPATILNEG